MILVYFFDTNPEMLKHFMVSEKLDTSRKSEEPGEYLLDLKANDFSSYKALILI